MIRLLAQFVIGLLANAAGLLAASALLDGFSIDAAAFISAVIIFSLATAILAPLILKIAISNASFLVGGIALVTTLVGLLITNIISDGLNIQGLDTWIAATVIIWLFSLISNLLLPLILFRKTLKKDKPEEEKA